MEQENMEGAGKKRFGMWHRGKNACTGGGIGSGAYGLGVIGAAIYYIQYAETFWMGIGGILKALVWPATVVYNILKFLHM